MDVLKNIRLELVRPKANGMELLEKQMKKLEGPSAPPIFLPFVV